MCITKLTAYQNPLFCAVQASGKLPSEGECLFSNEVKTIGSLYSKNTNVNTINNKNNMM